MMSHDPVAWMILAGIAVLVALYWRLNVLEARRLRLEQTRRAINKADLSHLILEGSPERVRSLGIEVAS